MKTFLTIAISIFLLAAAGSAQTTTTTTASATETKAAKKPTFRSTKDQVKQAQTMLKDRKLYTAEASGKSSAEWKAAVREYQGVNGLARTGSLNRATLEKMGIELTAKQKTIPVNPKHLAATSAETKHPTATTITTAGTAPSASDSPVGTKRPAPFRANEEQIKTAQKTLKDGRMYAGEETGKLDDTTREAIGKYQEANSLKVTKTLNAVTLEKMGIALTEDQKAKVAAQAAYDAAKPKTN